ncbi:cobalt-precorrin-5B (C(1))-methyltransferase CbiD [Paradesulfitobacterium aromaticivorans]
MTAKDRHQWREGYTTGSSAAAATKAACLQLQSILSQNLKNAPGTGTLITHVSIPLPNMARLTIPIHTCQGDGVKAHASVLKDGGDDPDVTNGLEIKSEVKFLSPHGPVHITGGHGVGTVTKKGLALPVGTSAINPTPRLMIEQAVREVFPTEELEVVIEVPQGEKIAQHTLNPRLGIVGGISILGTTGIVRPMSEEAFKSSILPEIDQAVAYGYRTVVLTPGNYGFRTAVEKMQVQPEAVIQMSNFVGYILEEAAYRGIKQVLLLGHVGKLIKIAGGIFHTHNRVADARSEILLAHSALAGIKQSVLSELVQIPTVEGAVKELLLLGHQGLVHKLAALASSRAQAFVHQEMTVGTVLTLLDGTFVGWDEEARKVAAAEKWTWPSGT